MCMWTTRTCHVRTCQKEAVDTTILGPSTVTLMPKSWTSKRNIRNFWSRKSILSMILSFLMVFCPIDSEYIIQTAWSRYSLKMQLAVTKAAGLLLNLWNIPSNMLEQKYFDVCSVFSSLYKARAQQGNCVCHSSTVLSLYPFSPSENQRSSTTLLLKRCLALAFITEPSTLRLWPLLLQAVFSSAKTAA